MGQRGKKKKNQFRDTTALANRRREILYAKILGDGTSFVRCYSVGFFMFSRFTMNSWVPDGETIF